MRKETKISVGVITYNQEATIRQTLDSILAQKGYFDLELVIGEDCSPDGTYAVCADYAKRYPDIVKLLPNTKNLGIMANFARVMKACTGDYVGICAGDDYWCDEQKLQKQLEYFKSHKDIGVVTTSGYKLLVQSNRLIPHSVIPVHPYNDGDVKKFYYSPEYRGGLFAMPLTMLIRRELLRFVDFDEFVRRGFPVEDLPMQAVLAQHTKWGHVDESCVVYRVYKESATYISFDHPRYLAVVKGMAEIRRYLNELFPADACFTELQLQEQLFYKEFLLYLHQFKYRETKQLIANVSANIPNSAKLKQANRFSKTWLHFIAAHYIKEYAYRKELQKRVNEI